MKVIEYPILVKQMTMEQTKEYHLAKLERLFLESKRGKKK